jgi:hypothetical protein
MIASRFVITSVLALLLTGAVGLIGWETDWGRRLVGSDNRLQSTKRASLDTKILPAFALAPLSPSGTGYRETIERPLFIPTRRPAPAGGGVQIAMKKGQFKLAGTTVSESISVAYLLETANNKTHRINRGAEINGMIVESVASNRVVLKQGEETEELLLRSSNSPKLPPPPPVAMAAPQVQTGQPAQQSGQQAIPAPNAPPSMPTAATVGFAPPGVNVPTGMPPGGNPMAQNPPGVGYPGGPGVAPGQNPANPAEAAAAQDPNQPAVRRRRFQNLPQ